MKTTAVLRMVQAAADCHPPNTHEARCLAAYRKIIDPIQDTTSQRYYDATARAAEAYKAHMPLLSDRDSIRAHVSCIAQGVLLGVLTGNEASKLLYAAQVALSTLERSSRHAAD